MGGPGVYGGCQGAWGCSVCVCMYVCGVGGVQGTNGWPDIHRIPLEWPHKASPRPYCAASQEKGTNTNTSSNLLPPYTSWSLAIKLRCLICRVDHRCCRETEVSICVRSWLLLGTLVWKNTTRSGMQCNAMMHIYSSCTAEKHNFIQANIHSFCPCCNTRKAKVYLPDS